jgi:hypothetical protein
MLRTFAAFYKTTSPPFYRSHYVYSYSVSTYNLLHQVCATNRNSATLNSGAPARDEFGALASPAGELRPQKALRSCRGATKRLPMNCKRTVLNLRNMQDLGVRITLQVAPMH